MPRNKTEATEGEEIAVGVTKTARARAVRTSTKKEALDAPPRPPRRRKVTPSKDSEIRKTFAPNGLDTSLNAANPMPFCMPTAEDVSVRAYFLSEHRRYLGLPGDSEDDWLEAERQIRSERARAIPSGLAK